MALLCLILLAGCRSDSGGRTDAWYSGMRPRDTLPETSGPDVSPAEALRVQLALGRTLESEKNWAAAEKAYRRILDRHPKSAEAAHRLAILLDRRNQFPSSEKLFRKALALRPGDPNIFCDVGYSYYRQRRWDEAERNLKQAVAIHADHARAHNHLGLLYAQLDRRKQALAEFKRAGATDAQAHMNVGLVLSLNDRLTEAQNEYQVALNYDPTSDEIRSRIQKIESVIARLDPPEQRERSRSARLVEHTAAAPARTTSAGRRTERIANPSHERKFATHNTPDPRRSNLNPRFLNIQPTPDDRFSTSPVLELDGALDRPLSLPEEKGPTAPSAMPPSRRVGTPNRSARLQPRRQPHTLELPHLNRGIDRTITASDVRQWRQSPRTHSRRNSPATRERDAPQRAARRDVEDVIQPIVYVEPATAQEQHVRPVKTAVAVDELLPIRRRRAVSSLQLITGSHPTQARRAGTLPDLEGVVSAARDGR